MEEYIVTVVNIGNNVESEISILADEAETTDDIILKTNIDGREICAADYNYLPAYQKLRDELLGMGYGIKCCGSRLNAVQSGMMGANYKIYLVRSGQQAKLCDIVSIYEYADIKEFPDTAEQNDFLEKWIASFK